MMFYSVIVTPVIATNIKSEWFTFSIERRVKILITFLNVHGCSDKSLWGFRDTDCYTKSGYEYKASSVDQASMEHSNLSLNSQNWKSIRESMETKQVCSGTCSDIFLELLCCSGTSWAQADAMIFNSLWFSYPGSIQSLIIVFA